jgi:hypothetical protein
MNSRTSELEEGTSEVQELPTRLESLDDIPREIAIRRLQGEFGDHLSEETSEELRDTPDLLENSEDFAASAKETGLSNTEGVLGWSTRLENPAHVLKGDVGREIATLIHEDLHRSTHPETLREIGNDPALRDLYEGITEHFTERAAAGLHGFNPGEVYPEQVEAARLLENEVGEGELRDWFFRHELSEDLQRAIDRFQGLAESSR